MSKVGNLLLDTNVVIAILNQEEGIAANLRGQTVYISSIVLGELYYGAQRSARVAGNLANIDRFLANCHLLICGKRIAWHYGRVKQQLQIKGRPIPENDLWIAATAIHHDLTLVSRDTHFADIDDLDLIRW